MKRLFLSVLCVVALASSAFAAVSPGHLPTSSDSRPVVIGGDDAGNPQDPIAESSDDRDASRRRPTSNPVQPVPEPGTMALASMGLIALGAAARRRRSS